MEQKLYVIVRNDLSPSQQAVQAGHALAEYVLNNDTNGWKNGTLVYLKAKGKIQLENISDKLEFKGIEHARFHEPDIGDELTAIASLGTNQIFKKLNLL